MGLFALAYLLFLLRTLNLARILRTPKGYVAVKLVLRTLYFGLILVAFLGPSFGRIRQEVKAMGKDVFICLDLSESMNAFDVQPSRLLKVKFELRNMLRGLEGDRVGLIVFSDEAFVQCPITFDQAALSVFIETLSTRVLNGGSTDFAPPLRLALEKLGNASGPNATNAKAIILISDGENFGPGVEEQIREARKAGVKLFTMGVGTAEGGPIPLAGNRFKTDNRGAQVISKLDPQSLTTIANGTGGRYYELNGDQNGFPALTRDVRALEGEVIEVKRLDVAANKYTWPLMAAAFLIFLDIIVPVRVLRLKE